MNQHFEDSLEFARQLDREDELAPFRAEFNFPDRRNGHDPVYFCGNSLGLQPKLARTLVEEELDNWARFAVDGHFHSSRPWTRYHEGCVDGFVHVTGAKPHEVTAMNTLTVNLHILMASFYRPTPTRYKIVIESKAFPSDRYAVASQLRMHGYDPQDGVLDWTPRDDERLYVEDLEALLDEHGDSVALLLLPGVQYYSGQVLDMAAISAIGRQRSITVGLDLAHAVGNVELALNGWAPDFAAWCTYKYLNSGPGAISGAFVAERHLAADNLDQLHGWWGNDPATRFRMARDFDPAPGADVFQMSNPPILSLAPVLGSLDIFLRASIQALRAKSVRLTGYLDWLLTQRFAAEIRSITPAESRGAQLSLVVTADGIEPRAVFDKLVERNVTGDWREPDVIRVAPAPLYNSFVDVYEFVERLEAVFAELRTAG
ncbi:MAG: kynureninase [Woeseiaceae bacterium]|jgi:kynureninase|nr:kynureninase [Woeseiaceae bacterium]